MAEDTLAQRVPRNKLSDTVHKSAWGKFDAVSVRMIAHPEVTDWVSAV
jgi:hypothetical protein